MIAAFVYSAIGLFVAAVVVFAARGLAPRARHEDGDEVARRHFEEHPDERDGGES